MLMVIKYPLPKPEGQVSLYELYPFSKMFMTIRLLNHHKIRLKRLLAAITLRQVLLTGVIGAGNGANVKEKRSFPVM